MNNNHSLQKNSHPIAVFDSGVGGLTVLRALREQLPHENFIYLGDTARVPYGNKSCTTIQRYSSEAVRFLLKHKIKLLVLGCNTVTAEALPALTEAFPELPIIGVIEPGSTAAAVHASKKQRIGVLSTRTTLLSQAYPKTIQALSPSSEVFSVAAPLLVPFAEEGWLKGEIVEQVVQHYLDQILAHSIDSLLLGCTHYPLFIPLIQKLLPDHIELIDSATTTAQTTVSHLTGMNLNNIEANPGNVKFFVTDDPQAFSRLGRLFLGQEIFPEAVTLTEL